jgi:hypothetical protein
MSEHEPPAESERTQAGSERDELRTMSFRMREIQRLLAARVEQENRRLEAEGVDPVEAPRFVRHEEHPD